MIPRARSMIAATYVNDIDASRAFYRLLGFREHSLGKAEVSAWSVMQHQGVSVLLASTGPALAGRLPDRRTVGPPCWAIMASSWLLLRRRCGHGCLGSGGVRDDQRDGGRQYEQFRQADSDRG